MSRVARKPISVPTQVTVQCNDSFVTVTGPRGELAMRVPDHVRLVNDQNLVAFELEQTTKEIKAQAGRFRSQVNNMMIGVSDGFTVTLELVGVGYKVSLQDRELSFSLGYSHLVRHTLADGVSAQVLSQTQLALSGEDKNKVTQEAAVIRGYRKPEPYGGKGIRYLGEKIRRKAVKKK